MKNLVDNDQVSCPAESWPRQLLENTVATALLSSVQSCRVQACHSVAVRHTYPREGTWPQDLSQPSYLSQEQKSLLPCLVAVTAAFHTVAGEKGQGGAREPLSP